MLVVSTADPWSPGVEVVVNAGVPGDVPATLLERAVRQVLEHAGRGTGELSVTLLPDDEIQALNARYLDRDRPTDVIAFSLGDAGALLGDIYIGYDQARRQAEDLSVSLDEELARLTIHGTLHVLGHDHPEGPERAESEMFQLQEALLQALLGGDDGT